MKCKTNPAKLIHDSSKMFINYNKLLFFKSRWISTDTKHWHWTKHNIKSTQHITPSGHHLSGPPTLLSSSRQVEPCALLSGEEERPAAEEMMPVWHQSLSCQTHTLPPLNNVRQQNQDPEQPTPPEQQRLHPHLGPDWSRPYMAIH